ncbi:hypothetical protein F5Y16DRAFT_413826 [Xylariaceae sp. FL0255]|nr:hypothetical protein F5Y16DRAFT_413826 [Xylariaceae sp. FL0255]
MEMVDPALRDNQDQIHPMEDSNNLAADPSLDDAIDIDQHHEQEDKSYWWVHRKDINAALVQSFEEKYAGFNLGVEKVLATRKRNGKVEHRIRWVGRPDHEDTWVLERYISPELVKKYKPNKAALKRRKRY